MDNPSPYASRIISNHFESNRKRRSVAALESAIDAYIAAEGGQVTKEDFLSNLSYNCDACNNHRDLLDNCSGTMTDCNGVETITADLQMQGPPGRK